MPAVMRLEGARELRRDLRRLGAEIGPQVIAESLESGAEVFLHAIQDRTPVRRGVLRSAFLVRSSKLNRKSSLFRKGVFRSGVSYRKAGAHAIPVEFGHRVVRNGRVVGHAAAHPFIRPAFEAARGAVEQTINTALRRGIDMRWGR